MLPLTVFLNSEKTEKLKRRETEINELFIYKLNTLNLELILLVITV
jgi:hypothetical protein